MLGRLMLVLGAILVFAIATAVTQLGGLVFLLALLIGRVARRAGMRKPVVILAGIVVFFVALPIINLYVIPPLATLGGREPLPCEATADRPYAALSPLYCILDRNYVRPEAKSMLD